MTPISWINAVVGKPWVDRASGPEAFDCWGLVIDSFSRIEGIEVPEVAGYASGDDISDAGPAESDSGRWQEVAAAKHGAVFCCYSSDGSMTHVGRVIFVPGSGLLCVHARGSNGKGSVAADPVRVIERAFHSVKYFIMAGR